MSESGEELAELGHTLPLQHREPRCLVSTVVANRTEENKWQMLRLGRETETK